MDGPAPAEAKQPMYIHLNGGPMFAFAGCTCRVGKMPAKLRDRDDSRQHDVISLDPTSECR